MLWRFISTSCLSTFSCCTFLFYLQYLKLSWFPIFHLEIRKPTWWTLLIVNSLGKDQYSSMLVRVEFQPIQQYQLLNPSDPPDTDYNWLYQSIQKFLDAKINIDFTWRHTEDFRYKLLMYSCVKMMTLLNSKFWEMNSEK